MKTTSNAIDVSDIFQSISFPIWQILLSIARNPSVAEYIIVYNSIYIAFRVFGGRVKWQLSNGYANARWSKRQSGDKSPSSGGVCGRGRGLVSRPKASSAAPFSIACLTAHARNSSAARHPRHDQPFQRSPSVQFQICALTPAVVADRICRVCCLNASLLLGA